MRCDPLTQINASPSADTIISAESFMSTDVSFDLDGRGFRHAQMRAARTGPTLGSCSSDGSACASASEMCFFVAVIFLVADLSDEVDRESSSGNSHSTRSANTPQQGGGLVGGQRPRGPALDQVR